MTKIINNLVIHFINLFKNNGKIIFIIIICSNCIITPKWDVIMNLFFSLTVFLDWYYCVIFIDKYQYICLHNASENEKKYVLRQSKQTNYTFLAANWIKSRDQIKFGQIQFKTFILKLNQVKFKLKCVDSNFEQIKSITKKSN